MPRATPLPADERRAALIAATEPLIEHFGRDVSTKRIAEAAGVAEGTIFRVFPTKEALIDAVCDQVTDLERVCAEIRSIDRDTDLETRLTGAVSVMQRRLRSIFRLFHALRMGQRRPFDADALRAKQESDNQRLRAALAELLEPDQNQLRMPVDEAADALRMVTLALTQPMLSDHRPYEPRQIVDLVLHGISQPGGPRACEPHQPPRTDPTGSTAC